MHKSPPFCARNCGWASAVAGSIILLHCRLSPLSLLKKVGFRRTLPGPASPARDCREESPPGSVAPRSGESQPPTLTMGGGVSTLPYRRQGSACAPLHNCFRNFKVALRRTSGSSHAPAGKAPLSLLKKVGFRRTLPALPSSLAFIPFAKHPLFANRLLFLLSLYANSPLFANGMCF